MNYKNFSIFGDVAESAMKEFITDNDIDIRTSIKLEDLIDRLCSLEQDDTFDSIFKVGVTMLFKWVAYVMMDICNNEAISKYRHYDSENTGRLVQYMFMDWDIGKVCESDPVLIAIDKSQANLATMEVEFIWSSYTVGSMLSFLRALKMFDFLRFDTSKLKIDTGDALLDNHFKGFITGKNKPTFIDLYMMYAFSAGKQYDINSKTVESYKNIARCSFFDTQSKLDTFMGIFTQMLTYYTTFERVQVESKGESVCIMPESVMDLEIEKIVMMGMIYMEENHKIIAGKLRKTSTFAIPTMFDGDYFKEYHNL